MGAGQNLHVVAVMRSEASGLQLDRECTEMNGARFEAHVGPLKDVRPEIEIFKTLDVLILDVNPKDAGEIAVLDTIVNKYFPDVPVVGTAPDATIQDVRQLMRLGVVDFVPQPITRADLQAALSLAASKRKATTAGAGKKGKVISFLKGGGGVGATTLAAQAGCFLAADYAKQDKEVCLIDLDIQRGIAALYLDLDNRVGFGDLIESPERLDGSLLAGVTTKHESGLHLLASPREVMPLEIMTPEFVAALIDVARDIYEVILIDMPPVWNEGMYTALEQSDLILLVTQLSVSGIRQTKHQLDTLHMQGLLDVDVQLVLNRYEKGWNRAVQLKEAEKAMGRRIDHCVPNDYKTMSEALNQGVSISRIKMRSKLEKGIRQMIEGAVSTIEANQRDEKSLSAA
jgi:pilus assembly protein CpaE